MMTILVDTSALFGYLSRRDQHHARAMRHAKALQGRASIEIPRISFIETMGHLSRREYGPQARLEGLAALSTLGWLIRDHQDSDYEHATDMWKRFADWPIEFPDALILATAIREKVDGIWLFDKRFTTLISKVAPRLKCVGSGYGEWPNE